MLSDNAQIVNTMLAHVRRHLEGETRIQFVLGIAIAEQIAQRGARKRNVPLPDCAPVFRGFVYQLDGVAVAAPITGQVKAWRRLRAFKRITDF